MCCCLQSALNFSCLGFYTVENFRMALVLQKNVRRFIRCRSFMAKLYGVVMERITRRDWIDCRIWVDNGSAISGEKTLTVGAHEHREAAIAVQKISPLSLPRGARELLQVLIFQRNLAHHCGHCSSSIATNFSAAGESEAPRRETSPSVLSTTGSTNGTLTSVG